MHVETTESRYSQNRFQPPQSIFEVVNDTVMGLGMVGVSGGAFLGRRLYSPCSWGYMARPPLQRIACSLLRSGTLDPEEFSSSSKSRHRVRRKSWSYSLAEVILIDDASWLGCSAENHSVTETETSGWVMVDNKRVLSAIPAGFPSQHLISLDT